VATGSSPATASVPAAASPSTIPAAADPLVAAAIAKAKAAGKQVLVDQDPRSQRLANPDGTMTSVVSPVPVRYQDGAGAWHDIDLTLAGQLDGSVAARAAVPGPHLARSADGPLHIPTSAGDIIAVHPGASKATAVLSANRASYSRGLGSRDLSESVLVHGVEEGVVLHSAADPASYTVTFTLPVGVTAKSVPNYGVAFDDAAGKQLLAYGGGFTHDANPSTSYPGRRPDRHGHHPGGPERHHRDGQHQLQPRLARRPGPGLSRDHRPELLHQYLLHRRRAGQLGRERQLHLAVRLQRTASRLRLRCRRDRRATGSYTVPFGGTLKTYSLDGQSSIQRVPPSGWSPLTAPDVQIPFYGLPARPSDPSLLASWQLRYRNFAGPQATGMCTLDAITNGMTGSDAYDFYSGYEANSSGSAGPYYAAFAVDSPPSTDPKDVSGQACNDRPVGFSSWVGLQASNGYKLLQDGVDPNGTGTSQNLWWESIKYDPQTNRLYDTHEVAFLDSQGNPKFSTSGDSVDEYVAFDPSSGTPMYTVYDETNGQYGQVSPSGESDYWAGDRGQFIDERNQHGGAVSELLPFTSHDWSQATGLYRAARESRLLEFGSEVGGHVLPSGRHDRHPDVAATCNYLRSRLGQPVLHVLLEFLWHSTFSACSLARSRCGYLGYPVVSVCAVRLPRVRRLSRLPVRAAARPLPSEQGREVLR